MFVHAHALMLLRMRLPKNKPKTRTNTTGPHPLTPPPAPPHHAQVATCLGTFLKKFGDAVLPYVERVMGQIAPLLDKGRSHEERRIAVCVVDDLLEHSPAGRAKYAAQ
eukprot:12010-Chlamydomonas_euryale.AAC.1